MMRDDYGFKGRRKNLISKEAQKGVGTDNPYDPEVTKRTIRVWHHPVSDPQSAP